MLSKLRQLLARWKARAKFYGNTNMSTGYVVGYYNPNKFPINVSVPQLNGSITLEEGRFIQTKDGRKINDPIFERYCGPNRLQREVSRTPVPLVRIPAVKTAATAKTGFAGVSQHMTPNPPANPQRIDNGVMGMSMDEARRLGFIKGPNSMTPESPIKETAQATVGPIEAPVVEAADQDVAQKPVLNGQALPTTVINIPEKPRPQASAPVAETEMAPAVSLEEVQAAPVAPQAHVPGQPLPPPQLPPELTVSQPITEAAQIAGFKTEEAPAQPTAPPPQAPPARRPTRVAPPTNLPDPQLTPEPATPVQAAATTVKRAFSCPRCTSDAKTQNYRFRSQLADHVRRKHAQEFDAIMAQFPRA